MTVASFHRLLTGAALAAALAAATYLLLARSDEAALSGARDALQDGRPRAALAHLDDVGDARTVRGRAAALAAQAQFALGDARAGIASLRRAVEARPNDWRLRRDLAVGLAAIGDIDGAREQAIRTLELNPRATLPSGFNVRVGRD